MQIRISYYFNVLLACAVLGGCVPLAQFPPEPVAANSVPAPEPKPVEAEPKKRVAKPDTTPKVKSQTQCGITLSDSVENMAEQYYVKAERAFNNDDIKRAKQGLETAVCLNPKHKQAKDLLQLLKQTYPEN